ARAYGRRKRGRYMTLRFSICMLAMACAIPSNRVAADEGRSEGRNDDRCARGRADHCKTFILVTGRRDPRMYAIDLDKALRPANQNTPSAIVSRSKSALDALDGRPLGDPANIAISEDGKTAYVVNHHGAIDNAEFLQHGGRGNVAAMNIQKMI